MEALGCLKAQMDCRHGKWLSGVGDTLAAGEDAGGVGRVGADWWRNLPRRAQSQQFGFDLRVSEALWIA